ncbi:MAG: hypothetical protein IPJ69_11510 [Deltaproteobacteria bacterium]|nr:MAG: hypothetical protein IPJ69_11510 [Deltaproteobacteria bacterium]
MGVESLNSGARFTGSDRLEAARDARRTANREGEAQLAKTHTTSQRTSVAQRDSFQKARTLAQQAQLLNEGRQHVADSRAEQTSKAAETPHPEHAQSQPTSETTPPPQAAHNDQPVHEQPTTPTTPPQEAAAPEQQAPVDNYPQPDMAGQPVAAHDAPAVPNQVSQAPGTEHSQNNPQGEGQAGTQAQPRTTGSTPESESTTPPRTSAAPEAHLTPEQILQRRLIQLQGGEPVQPRAQATTPQTPEPLVAQGTMTPTAPAPQTNAEHSLPQGAMKVFENGDIPADHADSYAAGLKAAIVLRQTEASRPEGAGSAPMLNAAASLLSANPPMTREQMLARLNRDNSRGRDGEEGSVNGLQRRSAGLTRDYMIGSRRERQWG